MVLAVAPGGAGTTRHGDDADGRASGCGWSAPRGRRVGWPVDQLEQGRRSGASDARKAAQLMTTDVEPLHVLVVEDDPGDVALIESTLGDKSVPTTVHHVADGADALAFLHRQEGYDDAPRPDLILLDLNMPRVDGRQVLAQIKADPRLMAIPVVVFTTSATPDDIVGSYTAHANAYVTKPLDLDQFEHTLRRVRSFFGRTATLPGRAHDIAGLD
jgi:CheY-like chemotaxis protein